LYKRGSPATQYIWQTRGGRRLVQIVVWQYALRLLGTTQVLSV
jgi:hypothetical protein